MRIELFFSGTLLFCAAALASAQKPFEGTIVYDVVAGDKPMQMTVTTRGSKVRRYVSMPDAPNVSRGNYQMIDFKTAEATMVFPAMKRYMVMKIAGLGDAAEYGVVTAFSTDMLHFVMFVLAGADNGF